MLIALLVVSGTAAAACRDCASESDFFDFTYAKSAWTELASRDEFRAEWNRVFPAAKAAYDEGILRGTVADMRAALADRPDAELVMQGYDLWLAKSRVWVPALTNQPGRGSGGLNHVSNPTGVYCGGTILRNIFTHKCDDLPDWRTEDEAAADARRRERVEAQLAQ